MSGDYDGLILDAVREAAQSLVGEPPETYPTGV